MNSPAEAHVSQPLAQHPEAEIHLREFLPIFMAVFLPMFMAAVDQTLLATATPVIATELGGLRDTSWVAVSYLLAAAAVVPLYGWLGDRLGLARVLRYSLTTFALGSLACGLAQNLPQLVAARVLQGLGGGGLMVLSQALIGELLPPRQRGRFQGYFAAVYTLASVGGPVLGGLIVSVVSWRWLFLGNLPLAALAMWRLYVLRGVRSNGHIGDKVDSKGLVLFPLLVALSIYWLSSVGHHFPWNSWPSLTLLAAAVTSGIWLVRHEKKTPHPFLNAQLLGHPAMRSLILMTMSFASCMFALIFYLPIYLQLCLQSSAVKSGLLILPVTGGIVVGSTLCGQALAKGVLPKYLPTLGLGTASLALALLAWLGAEPHLIVILGSIAGTGFGCVMPTAQVVAQTVAGRGRLGAATSMIGLSRSLGAALGTTVFGVLIFTLLPGVPHGATPADFLKLPTAQVQHAFHMAFGVMAVTAALGSWIASRAPSVQLR
ncbi:MAG TPA: MFS transporter [Rhodocyclaceae bacterium]|nr:MFS transporter [Rhodocyclaceae bacterium]